MGSIFNALHIGYSGLNAAHIGIDTTGHNIANAETEGYTRQRVVTAAATPISIDPGQRGNGTQITEIARIFDQFVFDRYASTSQAKDYSDAMTKNLQELSTYFPEIDKVGIKNDLQNYFNSWQSLANNPGNSSLKVDLAQQAQNLTQHINSTRTQITGLQSSLNDQLAVNINEVNRIAEQIAGTAFSVKITARDAFNTTVSDYTGTATITSNSTLTAGFVALYSESANFAPVSSSWPVNALGPVSGAWNAK